MMGFGGDASVLLPDAAARAVRYVEQLGDRAVGPSTDAVESLSELVGELPAAGTDPAEVIRVLDEVGSPATVASAGGRYFGFVVGGSLPVAVAANWLAAAWDQNAPLEFLSPTATKLEELAIEWLVDLFGLPSTAWGGLVSGATTANFTALLAARNAVLAGQGWDVVEEGVFGAPEVRVVVGDEVHVSVLLALRHLGVGRERIVRVRTDDQGRIRPEALPSLDSGTILCVQAGNVNSGAFDPAAEICRLAADVGAWVHVDGAFGMWAATTPDRAHLTAGIELADSWSVDAHKWLNVPYDCGVVLCREPANLTRVCGIDPAGYLTAIEDKAPDSFTPTMSRRARGVDVWAALRTLGRNGLADMIETSCRHAQRFAAGIRQAGYEVLNEVVINQVLASFGDDEVTRRIVDQVQQNGVCFPTGTTWKGRAAMRISVSSAATDDSDVQRSLDAMLQAAAQHR